MNMTDFLNSASPKKPKWWRGHIYWYSFTFYL